MNGERRQRRSTFAGDALGYWLDAVARQRQLHALVLADAQGLLLAASGQGQEMEELAALAPLVGRKSDAALRLRRRRMALCVGEVQVERSRLYLCAYGAEERGRAGVQQAVSGVRRILSQ